MISEDEPDSELLPSLTNQTKNSILPRDYKEFNFDAAKVSEDEKGFKRRRMLLMPENNEKPSKGKQ